jgi:hypothetical protein
MAYGLMLCIKVPESEKELYYKAKGNRTWKAIMEDALFGDQKPTDLVSYAEMEAFFNQKIEELKLALAKD